ncbi:hypothetical protein LguiA_019987 [Lonicera macranthoides]
MGSREKDQGTPHQPLLSSLVVRPTDSGGAGGGAGGGGGSDYEPGEVRRDPPPYSRSDRLNDNNGYRMRAGSVSPVRGRRNADHRYSPDIDHSDGPRRSRGFGRGRGVSRYRDYSPPPYGRGRDIGRFGRGFAGPGLGPGPFRGNGMPRGNPNVRPREGDWMCPDPLCNNLNFARRDHCNNCHRPRYPPGGRGYPGPPPPPPRRFPGPSLDRSPLRINGYRSPPRGWPADGPRDYGAGGPLHPRHEGRFPDHHIRRDRPDYLEDDFRDRNRFDRPIPSPDWSRDRGGRDNLLGDRKGYERRLPSPPLPPPPPPPPRGGGRFARERSRSPVRGLGQPPLKDYRRDMYADRGRDDRPLPRRDRISDAY